MLHCAPSLLLRAKPASETEVRIVGAGVTALFDCSEPSRHGVLELRCLPACRRPSRVGRRGLCHTFEGTPSRPTSAGALTRDSRGSRTIKWNGVPNALGWRLGRSVGSTATSVAPVTDLPHKTKLVMENGTLIMPLCAQR